MAYQELTNHPTPSRRTICLRFVAAVTFGLAIAAAPRAAACPGGDHCGLHDHHGAAHADHEHHLHDEHAPVVGMFVPSGRSVVRREISANGLQDGAWRSSIGGASGTPFRFGVVGDTQGLAYVEQLITDMNAHDPTAVVFPGDLVSTGSIGAWNQWDDRTSHFVGGPDNRLPVPGNHDLPVGGDVQWQQTFNWLPDSQLVGGVRGIDQMDYFVDYGSTRFISITTDSQAHGAGGPPAAQRWLENVLSDPSTQAKEHVFVYSHHPITFNNYDGTGGTAGPWWQAMANSGVVDGVFVGHWHQYQPSSPDPYHDTWEIISGTGNSGYNGHPWQNHVGYSMVTVDGPQVTLDFYGDRDGDGSFNDLLDSFVMTDSMPRPTGVVAHYGFDDPQVNREFALSVLSRGNSGDYQGGAQVVLGGVRGSALALDGNGDYADGHGIGDYNMAILRDLTISMHANFNSLDAGPGANTLISHTADVGGYTDREEAVNQPYNLRIRDDRRIEFFWERNNNVKEVFVSTAPADVQAGQWHEYRVTRDAASGELTFYVDGSQLGGVLGFDPMGELPTGGAQGFLRIGINYNRDHPAKLVGEFDGLVDELTIWNEATTDTYEPPPLGDVNLDGILSGDGTGPPEEDDVSAFIAGWMTVSIEDDTITRWMKGDLNLSGASELDDVVLFQQGLISAGLTFPGFGPFVPEPSTAWLLVVGAILLAARRQGILKTWQQRRETNSAARPSAATKT